MQACREFLIRDGCKGANKAVRATMKEKGNVLLFRMAMVRPDQICLKLDREAVTELVDKPSFRF